MVIVINEKITNSQTSEKELESLVSKTFLKSIDLVWWLKQLALFRTLTWLPSLARAAFVIVLREEYLKTEQEIAEFVGLTRNTVRNILRADPELALYKLQHLEELTKEQKKQLKVHIAGWIAKIAYKMIKEWQEPEVAKYFACDTAQALDIPWAILILKRIKWFHFPIQSPDQLKEIAKGIFVDSIPLEEIINHLEYPILSPSDLLHKIKQYVKMINQ